MNGGVGVRWRLGVRLTVRFFLGEDFFGFLLHKQPATQTDQHAQDVRNHQYRHDPLVAVPPISQQNPSDNAIKPGRREGVAGPARELICCQRAVEAARSGHRGGVSGRAVRSPRRRGGL